MSYTPANHQGASMFWPPLSLAIVFHCKPVEMATLILLLVKESGFVMMNEMM